MDNQVKVAHIQGRYKFITAVVVAIIGVFSVSVQYINTVTSEKNSLSNQIVELEKQLNDINSSYLDLQGAYRELENQNKQLNADYSRIEEEYQKLLKETESSEIYSTTGSTIEEKWIDQSYVFYSEGKHISGSESEGWYKKWDSSVQKDSLGNEHNHGIYVRGYREDTYILEYVLDDTYTGIKGLFTLEYESRNTQVESNLKVYSIDDSYEKELLYSTSQPLYGGIEPISFDFPINGADHIRFEISSGSGDKGEFFLALVDTCFYK